MMLVSYFDQLQFNHLIHDWFNRPHRLVLTPLAPSVEPPYPQNLELLIWSSMTNCTIVSLTCKSLGLTLRQ